MKKILSVIIVIAMLMQGVSMSALAVILTDEVSIISVRASDLEVNEDVDCWSEYFWVEDENGNGSRVEWLCYDADPTEITVTYEQDGDVGEFTGDVWEVGDFFGVNVEIVSGQAYDNQWLPGETYECSVIVGEAVGTYNVTVVPAPVQAIELANGPLHVMEYTNGSYALYREYGDEPTTGIDVGYFYRYNLRTDDLMFNVTLAYGDVVQMSLDEICDEYGLWYHYNSDQSYYTPWGVGEHKFDLEIGKFKVEIPLVIEESCVAGVSVAEGIQPIYEGCDVYTDSEWFDGDYYEYDKYSYGQPTYEITYKDGTSEVIEAWELYDKFNTSYRIIDDQSYSNQWGVGSHTATAYVLGFEVDFEVEIIEFPIKSIELANGPLHVMEYTNGNYSSYEEYDVETDTWVTIGYFYSYNLRADDLIFNVTLANGDVVQMSLSEVCNEYDLWYSYRNDQSYYTPWGVGEHKINLEIGSFNVEVSYVIEESNIESVCIAESPKPVLVGVDGYTSSEWFDGEWHEYFKYNYNQPTYEIIYKDGTSELIKEWELYGKFNTYPRINDDQSYSNQWGLGSHTLTVFVLGFETSFEVEVIEFPIKSIELAGEPLHVMEYTHGYYSSYEEYDEETDTWVKVGYYYYYSHYNLTDDDLMFNVTLANGDVVQMTLDQISNEYDLHWGERSDQSYYTPWGVGEHMYYLVSDLIDAEIPLVIEESCVADVSIAEGIQPIYEGRDVYTDSEWIDGDYYEYDKYSYGQPAYEITYKDGTSEVLGAWEIYEKLGAYPDTRDDQSYYNRWGLGSHTATAYLLGFEVEFEVEIVEPPVRSVTLVSAPSPVMEYTHGFYQTYYTYDEELGCDVENMYFHYYTPDDFVLEIELSGGEVITASGDELYEYGFDWHYHEDQYSSDPWGVGEHWIMVCVEETPCDIPFTIIESDIVSVTAVASPFEVCEYTNGFYQHYGDETWFEYNVLPELFRIEHKDGSVETLERWEISEVYGMYPEFSDDQSYSSQWFLGTHSATAYVLGYECKYEVNIVENPIKNIVVGDVVRYQNVDGWHDYDYDTGEEWFCYNAQPETVTVELKDGSVIEGDFYDVLDDLGLRYEIGSDQSSDNRWDVGTHKAVVTIGGVDYEYNVQILPLPIVSVKFVKAPAKTSYLEYDYIDTSGAVLRIEYVDGSYDDVELGGTFDSYGGLHFVSTYMERGVGISREVYKSVDGKRCTIVADVCGIYDTYTCSFKERNAATSVELSNENGQLCLSYTIDGKQYKENVLDIRTLFVESQYGQEAVITLPSGKYMAHITCDYTYETNTYSNISVYMFDARSNTLESSPWFNAFMLFDNLSRYTGDFLRTIDVMDIDGKITPENAYFAANYALQLYYYAYFRLPDLDVTLGFTDQAMMISQGDLKKLIAAVYNIDGEIDLTSKELDSMLSDGYYSFTRSGIGVFDDRFSKPYGCVAVKLGDSFAYDFSTVFSYGGRTIEYMIRIMPDGTFGKIVTARELIGHELVVSDSFKTDYTEGAALDLGGLSIKCIYEGGVETTIPVTSDMVSGYDPAKVGEQVVTVTYGELVASVTVTVNKAPEYPKGDVNADKKVNMKDVLMTRKAIARVLTLTEEEGKRADVNGDNVVNMKDVLLLRKVCANLITLD